MSVRHGFSYPRIIAGLTAVGALCAVFALSRQDQAVSLVSEQEVAVFDPATDPLLIAMKASNEACRLRDYAEFCETLSAVRFFLESFALTDHQFSRHPNFQDSIHVLVSHLSEAERDSFVAYKTNVFNAYHIQQTYKKFGDLADDIHPDLKTLVDAAQYMQIDDLFSRQNQEKLSRLTGDAAVIQAAFLAADLGADIGVLRAHLLAKVDFDTPSRSVDPRLETLLEIWKTYRENISDPSVSLQDAINKAQRDFDALQVENDEPNIDSSGRLEL